SSGGGRHHSGNARNRQLYFGGVFPRHNARAHRSGHARKSGSPPRIQGERHHGSLDSGGNGIPGVSRSPARGKRRANRRTSDGRSRNAAGDRVRSTSRRANGLAFHRNALQFV